MAIGLRCSRVSFLGWCLAVALLIASGAPSGQALAQGAGKEPILIGVTGPLTGQYAQYGAQWKRGFDLALDEINADGGINGRPL